MGKAEILSETGEGAYSIRVEFDVSKLNAAISKAQERLSELADLVDDAEMKYSSAMTAYQALQTGETLAAYLTAKNRVNSLAIAKLSAEKELERLQAVDDHVNMSAWCADYTTGMTGVVGTIEVPGERGRVQIRPGYDNGAVYVAGRDGQLVPTAAMIPEQAFYNLAMLPGWQKWKPTFRYGTITEIDEEGDTCSVTLDPAASSQQSLAVNQASELSGVPISYMNCNAEAFEVGDQVVVEFSGQSWESPKVIGFRSDPKPCSVKIRLTVNGIAPQKYFRIRLFHPDHGYDACKYLTPDPDTPGTYTILAENVPGDFSGLGDCYAEMECVNYSDAECTDTFRSKWFTTFWAPEISHVTSVEAAIADIPSKDVISIYQEDPGNLLMLPDLGEYDRKHIWLHNDGGEYFTVTSRGYYLDVTSTAHFYWSGNAWDIPEEPLEATTPVYRGLEIFQLSSRDYLKFSDSRNNVANGAWYMPVKWARCPQKLSAGGFSLGAYSVGMAVWNVAFFGNPLVTRDAAVLCACEGTLNVRDPVAGYNRDPGVSTQIPPLSINFEPGTGSTGSCSSTTGYIMNSHVAFLQETTAAAGSEVLLTDMFGTEEPEYTDWDYWLSAYTADNQVFDEWWVGENVYCTITGTIMNYLFAEFSKELLPEGEF